jgi:hypothetical protein
MALRTKIAIVPNSGICISRARKHWSSESPWISGWMKRLREDTDEFTRMLAIFEGSDVPEKTVPGPSSI